MELYPDPESNKEERKKAGAENKLFRLRDTALNEHSTVFSVQ